MCWALFEGCLPEGAWHKPPSEISSLQLKKGLELWCGQESWIEAFPPTPACPNGIWPRVKSPSGGGLSSGLSPLKSLPAALAYRSLHRTRWAAFLPEWAQGGPGVPGIMSIQLQVWPLRAPCAVRAQ